VILGAQDPNQVTEFSKRRFNVIAPLLRQEKYQEAERLARAHLAEVEVKTGRDSIETARSLTLLADCLMRLGLEGPETREYAERALKLKQKILGPEHSETLYNLALLAGQMSVAYERAEAESLYRKILELREKTNGPDHPRFAEALNDLAVHYWRVGEYGLARPLAERSLAILEKALGPDKPELGDVLTTIGWSLARSGDPRGARAAFQRTLDLREKAWGPGARLTIAAMNNLAGHYSDTGELTEARTLYERANGLRIKLLGPDHPAIAIGFHNLAGVIERTGDYAQARTLLEQALALRERTIGKGHPLYASTLERIAEIAQLTGDYATARSLYQQVLDIFKRTLGPDHPDYLAAQRAYALLMAQLGETRRAFELAVNTARGWTNHVRLTAQTLVERSALLYSNREGTGLELATSLAAASPELGPEARRRVWDEWMRSRALVLDEMASRQRAVSSSSDPELVRLQRDLSGARRRLARLVVSPTATDTATRVEAARQAKDRAERALAEKSAAARRSLTRSQLGYAEITAALPKSSALVAFMRSKRYHFAAAKPVPALVAFVVRDGEQDPALIPLGPESEIEPAISKWRSEISRESTAAGFAAKHGEEQARATGIALRRLLWDPVAAHLQGVERVFIVPDGPVHLVNLAALPSGKDQYLVETGPLIHYLTAERDLVPGVPSPKGQGLLALGNPAFSGPGPKRTPGPHLRGATPACEDLARMQFEPLPATAREVDEIARIWRAGSPLRLSGALANEAQFQAQAPGKRVLHLATHGFFVGNNCTPAGTGRALVDDNPLLMSGLALAGANRRHTAREDEEDGMLTAEEIAGVNLDGVEWVVLSGCDTGLGKVETGEGVFGLRRAFQLAGAGTVIMSLWPVEDDEARAWMKSLYRQRLVRGLSTAESIRQATRSALAARRAAGLSTHPFHWGAFVAAGDWR
jgi:CHAT domain-containing protein/tetratricopeptide (TPR) repeat protein